MQTDFQPWEANYQSSCWWSIFGLAIGWWLMLFGHHPYWATLVCLACTIKGYKQLSIGRRRERGIEVERRAVASVMQHLEPMGYAIHHNISAGGLGNIDLIVRPPSSDASFVVEIKSYGGIIVRPWGITKHNRVYPLLKDLRQVRAQCRNRGADWHFPVLWCPESQLNRVALYRGVIVVNGPPQFLAAAIDRQKERVKLPAFVRFPNTPAPEFRSTLMSRNFRYDGAHYTWHGKVAPDEAAELSLFVRSAHGHFAFKPR